MTGAPDWAATAGIRPLGLVKTVVTRWRLTMLMPLAFAASVAAVSLVLPKRYTAVTTFVPEREEEVGLPTGLAALAGEFGVALGSGSSQSPQFYADLIESRQILDSLLLGTFADPREDAEPGDSVTLLRLLRGQRDEEAQKLARAREKLRNNLDVRVDAQSSIVSVAITSPYPDLAADAANRITDLINGFNTTVRQSRARARRQFTEQRLGSVQKELREAERQLQAFYARNQRWEQSPQLVFEEAQLSREAQTLQQVYQTLSQEYETARIQEVNDTPVITIVEHAVPPELRSWPRRTLMVVIALVAAGIVGVLAALILDFLDRMRRAGDPDYKSLDTFWSQIRTRLPFAGTPSG
jgi:uncharacterized protein involved in exopolysaccharide biosynthesis